MDHVGQRVNSLVRRGGAIALVIWLNLSSWAGFMGPAVASVHTYPEENGSVMVRSLQTVRDDHDRAWQLVLFHRHPDPQTEIVHLRLIGFPGQVTVQHPAPLQISHSTSVWNAADCTAETPQLPPNTGEYDVQAAIAPLTDNAPLHLALSTATGPINLTIPPYVVREWRAVGQAQSLPSGG